MHKCKWHLLLWVILKLIQEELSTLLGSQYANQELSFGVINVIMTLYTKRAWRAWRRELDSRGGRECQHHSQRWVKKSRRVFSEKKARVKAALLQGLETWDCYLSPDSVIFTSASLPQPCLCFCFPSCCRRLHC